jgi:hypothetical protein
MTSAPAVNRPKMGQKCHWAVGGLVDSTQIVVGHGPDEPGITAQQANPQRFEKHPQTLSWADDLLEIVGLRAQIRSAAHSSDYYTFKTLMHTRCSTNCQAALRPHGATLRRRASRPPAASLQYAGVREDESPLSHSSGRQAMSQKPVHGSRHRDV